ncbi:unnamed protein product, partial [Prunus brigantina]
MRFLRRLREKKLLRIFVGSSVGDLGPLLEAKIGIVINPCDHLLTVGYQFGVTFMRLLWAVIQKSKQMREACGARNKKPPHGDILEPKSAKIKNDAETAEDVKPKSACAKPPHYDILEPKSAKRAEVTNRASNKYPQQFLLLSLLKNLIKNENVEQAEKPKSATKLPSTEDEAETAKDKNVE